MLSNLFRVVGLKFILPTIFLLGCGSTDVSESKLISVSLTPATTNAVTQTSVINGYPIDLVVSRNGSVLSSVDDGIVAVRLIDPTTGCGGSGSSPCLRLQATSGPNAASVNSFSYANGKATLYVGANASVAQDLVSISGVAFILAASVAVDSVQASSSIRVIIQ